MLQYFGIDPRFILKIIEKCALVQIAFRAVDAILYVCVHVLHTHLFTESTLESEFNIHALNVHNSECMNRFEDCKHYIVALRMPL